MSSAQTDQLSRHFGLSVPAQGGDPDVGTRPRQTQPGETQPGEDPARRDPACQSAGQTQRGEAQAGAQRGEAQRGEASRTRNGSSGPRSGGCRHRDAGVGTGAAAQVRGRRAGRAGGPRLPRGVLRSSACRSRRRSGSAGSSRRQSRRSSCTRSVPSSARRQCRSSGSAWWREGGRRPDAPRRDPQGAGQVEGDEGRRPQVTKS